MRKGNDVVKGTVARMLGPREQRVPVQHPDDMRMLQGDVQRAINRGVIEEQHGQMVHVLMENGARCDKWVPIKSDPG